MGQKQFGFSSTLRIKSYRHHYEERKAIFFMGGSAAVITLDCNISADSVTLLWPLTSDLILNIEIVLKVGNFLEGTCFPMGPSKNATLQYLLLDEKLIRFLPCASS